MRSPGACLLSFLCLESVPLFAQDKAPECRIAAGVESPLQGNAGCLVKFNSKMLMVRHRETAKLSPPGGTSANEETAQCTAHRETWKETGVELRVGTLLKNVDRQSYLFHCVAVDEDFIKGPKGDLPVPEAFEREISEVLFLDPTTVSNDSWLFPTQAPAAREAFYNVLNQDREN